MIWHAVTTAKGIVRRCRTLGLSVIVVVEPIVWTGERGLLFSGHAIIQDSRIMAWFCNTAAPSFAAGQRIATALRITMVWLWQHALGSAVRIVTWVLLRISLLRLFACRGSACQLSKSTLESNMVGSLRRCICTQKGFWH